MSSGDAVCTGWLVKSPPERKLQRYAWRKRWFVLRRGRMSGNPDVLEYYRNKHSSKPIRVIDLSECAVWKHSGPGFVRKEFQNNFVFIVKTTSRTFYLVAKTEEEMQVWVYSITQVCNFGHLEGGAADSMESLSHTPCSLQPSSASSLHTAHAVSSSLPRDDPNSNTVATEETRSESEFPLLPDYLILSNCETGRLHRASLPTRCDSWSNSDRSLEQTSSDDVFVDGLQSLHYVNLADPLTRWNGSQEVPYYARPRNGSQEVPYYARPRDGSQEVPYYARPRNGSQEVPYYAKPRNGSQEVPYYAKPRNGSQEVPYYARPRASLIWNRDSSGPYRDHFSSPLLETSLNSTVQVDKNQGSLPYGATKLDLVPNVPPPRPPKPIHLSERRQEEQLLWSGHSSIKKPECTTAPRRISLSGLDNMRPWKADVEDQSLRQRDKRHSLNLPCRLSPMCPTASTSDEDSYVPMAPLGAISCLKTESNSDDYIPMSSGSFSSPLPELPANLEPPPVNRDLKPQRKPRSPPLDPRNLSTIREHASLTRTHTVPCNRTSFLSPERNGINSARFFASSVSREEKESNTQMGQHQTVNSRSSGAVMRTKKCNLDYLALDFNSASPAPVQQKLLSEEHKVDYVQVDEQKTQALQSTKQEWTDERQSKVEDPGGHLVLAPEDTVEEIKTSNGGRVCAPYTIDSSRQIVSVSQRKTIQVMGQ